MQCNRKIINIGIVQVLANTLKEGENNT